MGYDARAVAVIGVRHPPGFIKSKLFQDVTRRVCSHDFPEDHKYCPECGAPRTITFPMPIKELVDGGGDGDTLCGYELVNRGEGYYDDPEFIAYWTSNQVGRRETVSLKECDYLDLNDLRIKMYEKLGPLGQYNDDTFGIHVFLHESC